MSLYERLPAQIDLRPLLKLPVVARQCRGVVVVVIALLWRFLRVTAHRLSSRTHTVLLPAWDHYRPRSLDSDSWRKLIYFKLSSFREVFTRTKILVDEVFHQLEPYKPRSTHVRESRIMWSQDRHVYAASPDPYRDNLTIAQLYNVVNQGCRSRARAASRPDGGTMYQRYLLSYLAAIAPQKQR